MTKKLQVSISLRTIIVAAIIIGLVWFGWHYTRTVRTVKMVNANQVYLARALISKGIIKVNTPQPKPVQKSNVEKPGEVTKDKK